MNKNSPASVSMVYMMTNNEVMNQVIAFYRDMNGMLSFAGAYPTNGRGTGIRKSFSGNAKQWCRSTDVTRSINLIP